MKEGDVKQYFVNKNPRLYNRSRIMARVDDS